MKRKFLLTLGLIVIIVNFVSGDIEKRERSIAKSFFKEGVYHFNQQEYTAASNALVKALSTDPTFYKARYWLGKAYYQSGYVKNALIEWERALNLIENDHLLKNKMTRLFHQTIGKPQLDLTEIYLPTKGLSNPFSIDIQAPVSIYVDQDKLYWIVGYSSNKVVAFNKNGQKKVVLTKGNIPFNHPYDIIIDSKGEIYVSDFGNDTIHKYSSNREYKYSIGRSGLNNKEFYGPQGLAIDQYDNLYVVDKGNHRVQKFDNKGRFLIKFGKEGISREKMFNPTDLVVLNDQIYVTDTGNKRIQVYDLSGNWVKSLGENLFKEPKGIKKVSTHELFVADSKIGIVKVDINPLSYKIIKKNDKMLKSPIDMALDENHFLYITDLNRRDIPVFVFEKMKYSNLNVVHLQSYAADFPRVTHRLMVRDQTGNSIFGLTRHNFNVMENGVSHQVKVQAESDMKKSISLVVLNERSNSMKPHAKMLEKVLKQILHSLSTVDRVKVINFNQDYWVAQDFIRNELSSLKAILDNTQLKDEKKLGNGFYKAVTDIFTAQSSSNINYMGVVLLITSGELAENTFMPYGYEVCLNYAKNNNVPVYILSFSDGKIKDELVDLAHSTGGQYFNAYSSNKANRLVDFIKKYKKSIYYVQYDSRILRSRTNKWRDVEVIVNLKDLFGQDRAGYFTH